MPIANQSIPLSGDASECRLSKVSTELRMPIDESADFSSRKCNGLNLGISNNIGNWRTDAADGYFAGNIACFKGSNSGSIHDGRCLALKKQKEKTVFTIFDNQSFIRLKRFDR